MSCKINKSERMADTELIMKIISAVKKRDCLWNVNSPEYAKRDKLERAWQEVADDVGRPDVFCREKWRNVRTGFLRSIQYNAARAENSDGNEDLPTPKRKRFYLYDAIKFILQTKESVAGGQNAKLRKLSRNKLRTSHDEYVTSGAGGGDSADANIIQTYEDNRRYKNTSSTTNESASNSQYPELNEFPMNDNSGDFKPMTTGQAMTAAAHPIIINRATTSPQPLKLDETKSEPNLNSTPLVSAGLGSAVQTKCENISPMAESFNLNVTRMPGECDNRDEQQLIAFFRGNLDDILSLPRHKQRLFKRRMLELIDDLHGLDNGIGTSRYS